jgi:hypothetical protein
MLGVMNSKRYRVLVVWIVAMLAPLFASAQSDSGEMPLGDVARSLRRDEGLPAHTVIDNDNLSQVMQEVESRRLSGATLLFSVNQSGNGFKVSSPDVTCSLSFSAQAAPLLSDPFASQDLPDSELPKLDGPATLNGDSFQVSVYNGTGWVVREITVGLTLVRRENTPNPAEYGSAKLVPALAGESLLAAGEQAQKRSDVTLLIKLKAAAAPLSTTVFRQSLAAAPSPDQEWHWAIVKARGIPPPSAPLTEAGPTP